MSNNEILDNIFQNVSKKMINEYLKEISISYKNDKYHYSNNLDFEVLKKSIIENIDTISTTISKKLEIKDIDSIKLSLKQEYNSEEFLSSIKKISATFVSKKKLPSNELNNIYIEHLKHSLLAGNIKEKTLALASENDFKDWIKRRWKLIACGYALVLLIFIITYYVFINNED